MTKFTEGPWKVVSVKTFDNTPMLSIQQDCGQEDDTELSICGIYNVTDKAIANANLISSAPDLLEALQMVRDSTAVLNHLDSEDQQFICDTIKKALGQA
jgi:hypothetical protein